MRKFLGSSIAFLIFTLTTAFFSRGLAAESTEVPSNLHMQTTVISQSHPAFPARYSGSSSLTNESDNQTSITVTAFAGFHLWKLAEVYVNPELSGGSGFSRTRGMAAFPNGEIYRVDDAAPKWNLARLYLKQTFAFGDEQEEIKNDVNQLGGSAPVERLSVVLGRFALNDFFDKNRYSHDPRTQFLNWALMDNAAWDYAADTRGYSWGLYLEYNQRNFSVRLGSVLVPKQANQLEMETNFPQFRGDNLEFEYRFKNKFDEADEPGAVRFLIYDNHANMGNYRASVDASSGANADITQFRSPSDKYGVAFNAEQAFNETVGGFFRASWNNGRTESWAFTEADQAASVGLSFNGERWKFAGDVVGLALITNGLSNEHRDYLAAGGTGFILGDGKLNYALETLTEVYYLRHLLKGLDVTADYQFVQNPGYNADRGPVSIFSVRVHSEI